MTHLIPTLRLEAGEPAFDVASRIHCPLCEGARQGLDHGEAYMAETVGPAMMAIGGSFQHLGIGLIHI